MLTDILFTLRHVSIILMRVPPFDLHEIMLTGSFLLRILDEDRSKGEMDCFLVLALLRAATRAQLPPKALHIESRELKPQPGPLAFITHLAHENIGPRDFFLFEAAQEQIERTLVDRFKDGEFLHGVFLVLGRS